MMLNWKLLGLLVLCLFAGGESLEEARSTAGVMGMAKRTHP